MRFSLLMFAILVILFAVVSASGGTPIAPNYSFSEQMQRAYSKFMQDALELPGIMAVVIGSLLLAIVLGVVAIFYSPRPLVGEVLHPSGKPNWITHAQNNLRLESLRRYREAGGNPTVWRKMNGPRTRLKTAKNGNNKLEAINAAIWRQYDLYNRMHTKD